MVELVVLIALLFVFGIMLVKSTDILVTSIQHLSRLTKISKYGLTAVFMGIATSLPELTVGITSALEGKPSLSLGNVLGANLANLALVVGGAALVGGGIRMLGEFVKRDLIVGFFIGCLPLALLVDGRLSRWDGLILLLVYVVFVRTIVVEKPIKLISEEGEEIEPIYTRFFAFLRRRAVRSNVRQFVLGLIMLIGSGYAVVEISQQVALAVKVPLFLIGLFLVSIGTTLPEIAFAQRSIKNRQAQMILGNMLGTIAANSTLVLGIVALIMPVTPNGGIKPYLIGTVGYVLLFILFWFFASTKRKLARWEGAVLVLVYIVIMALEIVRV